MARISPVNKPMGSIIGSLLSAPNRRSGILGAHFDGTNDALLRGGGLTGQVDSKLGIIACRVRFGNLGSIVNIFNRDTSAFALYKLDTDKVAVYGKNGAAIVLRIDSTTTVASDIYYNVLIGFDMASQAASFLYLDDANSSDYVTFTNSAITNAAATEWSIGSATNLTGKIDADITFLYVATGETLDFSVEANRRKFFTASGEIANLGADGSVPTGTAPIIYLEGRYNQWERNKGSGEGLTVTGELTEPAGGAVYAIGDSVVAEYLGQTAVLGLIDSAYTEYEYAVPNDAIADQKADWLAGTIYDKKKCPWVVGQVGLNDLDPAEAASVAIARLQDLFDTIASQVGSQTLVLASQLTPCRQRLIDIYGAINGPIAYQKWLDINEAIEGLGANPITGVSGFIKDHVALLNDGSGNLDAAYDTGDGIHPNTAGRQIIATSWEDAIVANGRKV